MPKRAADEQSDSPEKKNDPKPFLQILPNGPPVPRNSMEPDPDASKISDIRASLQSSLQSLNAKLNEVKEKDQDGDVAMEDDEDEPGAGDGDKGGDKEGKEGHQNKKIKTHAEEGAGSGRYDPFY